MRRREDDGLELDGNFAARFAWLRCVLRLVCGPSMGRELEKELEKATAAICKLHALAEDEAPV
jgi:hypothetical protein